MSHLPQHFCVDFGECHQGFLVGELQMLVGGPEAEGWEMRKNDRGDEVLMIADDHGLLDVLVGAQEVLDGLRGYVLAA